ncbi:MAG TPA: APC family permease [Candidatus Polarisedimenticolia bacterium]|nr:APC family permease [Candidatus Polarisedimenticolia bacterium]
MTGSALPLRRGLGVLTLAGTIFVFASSGPFGLEAMVRDGGPGAAPLMLVLTLLFWGLSHTLVATELSSAVPEEGGFIRWIGMAFGPFWGFQAAWWYWIKMLADTSIYPILFSQYLAYWIPGMGQGAQRLIRLAFVWIFVGINLRGIKFGGRLAVGFTLFILAPFVLFVGLGLPRFSLADLHPLVAAGKSLTQGLGVALMLGMWCYNTLDSVSVVAGEVEDPTRTFGRAYALAIPCMFLIYFLPVVIGLGIDPAYATWGDQHFATLGGIVGGAWLGSWIALGALLANQSLFHGALMVNTRVPLVLAQEGKFPAPFAAIGRRYGAPWVSLLFDGVVYSLIALGVEHFVSIVVWNQWLNAGIYTLLYLSFLRLRVTRPDLPRRFKVPGGWIGAVAICVGPFLVCWLGVPIGARQMAWLGLMGLASGPVVWKLLGLWMRRRKERA